MKKYIFLYSSIVLVSALLQSCFGGSGKTDDSNENDTTQIKIESMPLPDISEVVGIIGDGTSMNVLEIITENGDTMEIECSNDRVVGGVEVGNKVSITYNNLGGEYHATTSINISALEHLWTQVGLDGHSQSLELNENGRATTYDMTVEYNKWSIENGMLLLYSPKKIASEQTVMVDTFEILELNDERLVLMYGDFETIFDREN